MKLEEEIKQKLDEAIDILSKFGMPSEQQNERTAYCLFSLLNVTPEKDWKNAENPLVGITPMMTFAKEYYNKEYAPNTRETFRRFSIHQMVQAGIVLYNPDKPDRPVNSPKAVYQISPAALKVIKAYKTNIFEKELVDFIKNNGGFDAFNFDLVVPYTESGRNVSYYTDTSVKGEFIDYLGNKQYYNEKSGICLQQSDFTLKRNSKFEEFIYSITGEFIDYIQF